MAQRLQRPIEYEDTDSEEVDFVCSDSGMKYETTIFDEWKHFSEEQHEEILRLRKELQILDTSSDLKNIQRLLHRKSDKDSATHLDDALNSFRLAEKDNSPKLDCLHCAESIRVLRVSEFNKGQHISMTGRFGKVYQHHAIVSKVISTSGMKVQLELIHFDKDENKVIKIDKNKKTYNLEVDELYITHYRQLNCSSTDIVNRADTILRDFKNSRFEKYNFLLSNCEHFATWCVKGEEECMQLQEALEKCVEVFTNTLGNGSQMVKAVTQLILMSTDEIAASVQSSIAPGIALGATACAYLVYCLAKTAYLVYTYKKKNICWVCLKRTLTDMWLGLGVFCGTSVVQYLIYTFAVPAIGSVIGIPLVIAVVVLSVWMKLSVQKLVRVLRNPFEMEKSKIEMPSQLTVGDIVSFKYYKLEHVAIVSFISDVNESSRTAKVRCVHYGLRSLLATREIVEEEFKMTPESWIRYDLNGPHIYSREERLSRARKRVGEKRWSITNRSDNFCNWATVKVPQEHDYVLEDHTYDELPTEDTVVTNAPTIMEKKKKPVELFLDEKPVYIAEELRLGDVITYHKLIVMVKGILVKKETSVVRHKEVLEIDIISLTPPVVGRMTFAIDLKENDVNVTHCHPARCISMQARVKRALFLETKRVPSINLTTMNTLIIACIVKEREFTFNGNFGEQILISFDDSPRGNSSYTSRSLFSQLKSLFLSEK